MTSPNDALVNEIQSDAFDNGILTLGLMMEWAKPKPSYEDMEQRLATLQARFDRLAITSLGAIADLMNERDMLARKVQELTAPAPSPAFEQLGHEITAAIGVMDELRRNRR